MGWPGRPAGRERLRLAAVAGWPRVERSARRAPARRADRAFAECAAPLGEPRLSGQPCASHGGDCLECGGGDGDVGGSFGGGVVGSSLASAASMATSPDPGLVLCVARGIIRIAVEVPSAGIDRLIGVAAGDRQRRDREDDAEPPERFRQTLGQSFSGYADHATPI